MLRRIVLGLVYKLGSAKQHMPTLRLPSFEHCQLYPRINEYLVGQNIHTPTYIQYALLTHLQRESPNTNTITHITSPTGSGKTLAYLLPIIDFLKKEEETQGAALTRADQPRALILTVNKELVLQCRNDAKQISHYCKLKVEGINIGRTLNQEKALLKSGVDVLVSTYFRLKNALANNELRLNNLSHLVIDQVDTLHESNGLNEVMKKLVLPFRDRMQIILSGTTNPPNLRKYLDDTLKKYTSLQDRQTHVNLHNIHHQFTQCFSLNKHDKLLSLLFQERDSKTMVFCNTASSLNELQYYLNEQGVSVLTLHSKLPKSVRLQNYEAFRDSEKAILLSTDLGARGLHFPGLGRVINYDFPDTTCDYLQRAGRTGRAGLKGRVISIYHSRHMKIINELRNASFDQPLKISNSAYGFKNRQETNRVKIYAKK